jgi:ABC-type antimicrobial peptide transport system permease subunit
MSSIVPENQNNENINTTLIGGNKKNKSCRSFKVKLDTTGELYGRYNGDSPYQAANKALSEIIRNKLKKNEEVEDEITFFLVESTKASTKKTHEYVGRRIKLDEPVQYTVSGNQTITKEFKNILRKVKKPNNRTKKSRKEASQ